MDPACFWHSDLCYTEDIQVSLKLLVLPSDNFSQYSVLQNISLWHIQLRQVP